MHTPSIATPSPREIFDARTEVGLSQEQAAALLYQTAATWERWERGALLMRPALWELFVSKSPPGAKGWPKKPVQPEPWEIRKARLAVDMTQADAAEQVGYTWRGWQAWERGVCRMPPPVWELFLFKTEQLGKR